MGGVLDQSAFEVAPGLVWRALANELNQLGVQFVFGAMPQHLVLGDAKITGFEHQDSVVECDHVFATDAEFAMASAAGLGRPLSFMSGQFSLAISSPVAPWLGPSVATADGRLLFWQAPDGEIILGEVSRPDGITKNTISDVAQFLLSVSPQLGSLKLRPLSHRISGLPKDGLPVLGEISGSNFYVSCGWGSARSTMAPIVAQYLAQVIAGVARPFEMDFLSPDRFAMARGVSLTAGIDTSAEQNS